MGAGPLQEREVSPFRGPATRRRAPGAGRALGTSPLQRRQVPGPGGLFTEPVAARGVELVVPGRELGGAGGGALRRPVAAVGEGAPQRAEPAPAHEAEVGGGRAEDGGEELVGQPFEATHAPDTEEKGASNAALLEEVNGLDSRVEKVEAKRLAPGVRESLHDSDGRRRARGRADRGQDA